MLGIFRTITRRVKFVHRFIVARVKTSMLRTTVCCSWKSFFDISVQHGTQCIFFHFAAVAITVAFHISIVLLYTTYIFWQRFNRQDLLFGIHWLSYKHEVRIIAFNFSFISPTSRFPFPVKSIATLKFVSYSKEIVEICHLKS